MKPLFVWDQDGVITNLTEAFVQKANELSGQPTLDPHVGGETWKFEDYYEDWVIKATFLDPDVWLKAPPFDDFLELFKLYQDRSVICSTPANEISAACKYRWLSDHGIPRDKFILAANKTYLARPGAILIDDNAENCAAFIRTGGQAILVLRHWSKSFDKASVQLAMANSVSTAAELRSILSKL